MSEAQPSPSNLNDEQLKVVFVDQSKDAQDEARDLADARLDRELGEGGRLKRFVNGIWKGNIAKDYYRQKYIHTELSAMQEANAVSSNSANAKMATIERFESEYDELIHTGAGEQKEEHDGQSELSTGVKSLIRDFVEGRLNEESLNEERTRLLNDYRAQHGPDSLGKGLVTTNNLVEVAKAVVGSLEYADSMDRATKLDSILSNVQVITGEARDGARTEAKYNTVDKLVDKLARHKIGSLVTPGTLAVGVAAAASIARMGSHSVVGAVTKTLIPGVAAGAWAGLRENRRVKDERTQHSREMATGGSFDQSNDKRRIEMEKTRYETIAAVDLIGHLQNVGSEETLDAGGADAVQAALDALAAIEARIDISDGRKTDLISYSSKADVGEERMMLDMARREARLAVEGRLNEEMRAELQLGPRADIRGLISQRAFLVSRELLDGEGGLTEKDKAFAKLKAKRVATATAVGVATGILGGLVVQEGVAALDPTRFGLIDALRGEAPVPSSDGTIHQTVLEGMFRGDQTTIHTDASSTYDSYASGSNGNIELSNDHSLVTNPDGSIDLRDGTGKVDISGLHTNPDGTFDQASLDKLSAAGMTVEDHSYNQEVVSSSTQTVSTEQYLQNHSAESTHVTRDLWYGNDTPNIYDQNELRVYRGGSDAAPGIVDGGYQYTVAGMTPDGSWQGGERVDWNQAAAGGNLFVAVSGTEDSQGNPFMIPIGPNGEVNIPADSPAGHFFANEDNSVAFKGAYMEIVQSTDVDQEGTVHIRPLATLVGESSVHEIQDTVTTSTTVHHAEYTITTNGYDTIQGNFTEMAPITPIASRRSMEAIRRAERGIGGDYYYGDRALAEQERLQLERETSPRLRNNPGAELNLGEELDWFSEELGRRKPDSYVRDLTAFVDNDPVLSNLNNDTESIVTIPVAAASESDNIYGTLSLYAQQDSEGVSRSTILLNVNWLDTVMDDQEKVAAIQKTIREIERARQDFPQLRISVMQKEYNTAEVKRTGGVIGYVAEDMINVALLAAQRRVASGAIDSDHNLLIVRGDADADGLARTQLRNFQRAAGSEKNLDIIKGATRFGSKDSIKYPGYGIVSSFMTSFNILASRENSIHTGGANFAIRASTLAAMGGLGEMLQADPDTGRLVRYTGAGSDDVQIGRRIAAIRRGEQVPSSNQYTTQSTYGPQATQQAGGVKRMKIITGAAADTSGERLRKLYLSGILPQRAWDRIKNGFADGPAGYRERGAAVGNEIQPDSEPIEGSRAFDMIEAAMTFELRNASIETGRKALSILFASAPGAYKIIPTTRGVQFKLTNSGRDFIKKRVQRETNGQFGSFGARKMRQLYGITAPNSRRKPASTVSPFVSPLQ